MNQRQVEELVNLPGKPRKIADLRKKKNQLLVAIAKNTDLEERDI